jgi:hypothetical protein
MVWIAMHQRCEDPKTIGWARYGGRGIKVCKRWKTFLPFWRDMEKGYAPGLQLERSNNDKGYSKSNCLWATRKQQSRNRGNTTWVKTPKGLMDLKSASEAFGIKYVTLRKRLEYGWPNRNLFDPVGPYVRKCA